MGFCATNDKKLADEIRYLQNALGVVPSPFDSFLALRGVKTLHLRMREHTKNATIIATFLESSDKVRKVTYPGLKSHPQYEIAQKQMRGAGGMITFYLKGGIKQATQFLTSLKLFTLAESLGGVESLVESPAIMTHASVPQELRQKLGIDDSMIRLSCGVEDSNDLLADIKHALEHVVLEK
jgi:cystathionine gamma-lyase